MRVCQDGAVAGERILPRGGDGLPLRSDWPAPGLPHRNRAATAIYTCVVPEDGVRVRGWFSEAFRGHYENFRI